MTFEEAEAACRRDRERGTERERANDRESNGKIGKEKEGGGGCNLLGAAFVLVDLVCCSGFRVQSSGFWVQGSGFRVLGSRFRV